MVLSMYSARLIQSYLPPSPTYASHSLDVLQDTSELTFNSSDLNISRPSVYSEALASFVDVDPSVTFNEKRGRATVKLAKALPAGSKAKFKIAYEGKLLSNMTGYYKSLWDHDGKKDHYSLTQFEVTSTIFYPSLPFFTTFP
jgi:aminopeptidase 2